MRAGEIVRVNHHVDLLNYLLNREYKGFYKSYLRIDNNTMIWMVHFDNKLRQGWCNKIVGNRIIEEFHNVKKAPTNIGVGTTLTRRIVFEITNNGYKFLGVYEFDAANSNLIHRELVKISDTYNF